MVKLRNVEHCYRTKAGFNYILRQINLDITEGNFITFMGPSGAGKSTLLGILGMYDGDWEGEHYVEDQPFYRLPPADGRLF
jgi:putative ABC transport system ATP-binding protein